MMASITTYRGQVLQFPNMFHQYGTFSDDIVNFLLDLAVNFGMLEQLVYGKGEGGGRGFMTCNQEGDQVVDDALVGHLAACHRIDTIEHGGQQVFPAAVLAFLFP